MASTTNCHGFLLTSAAVAVGAVVQQGSGYAIHGESSRGPSAWEDITANHSGQQPIDPIKWDYRYETSPFNSPLIKPDLVAPSGVFSTRQARDNNPTFTYALHQRTSSAAPHVAGAAALMLSADPSLAPWEIYEILHNSARDLGSSGKDNTYGSGLIDVYEAITDYVVAGKRLTVQDDQVAQQIASQPAPLSVEAFPNPFNPSTTIRYSLPTSDHVVLRVYDILGREVARLVDGVQQEGRHEVSFDASRLPSGVYLYRLETGSETVSRQLLLMK